MAEKYRTPKIKSIDLGEKAETIRAKIDTIGMYNILVDFQQTEIGQKILEDYNLEDIFDVFAYGEIFDQVTDDLNTRINEIDPMHFQAFMLVAAANDPDYITEFIQGHPSFQDSQPELVLMIDAILRKDESYIGMVTKVRKAIESKIGDESMDILAELSEFEKSPAGKEILLIYRLESIDEVFEDEDIFNAILAELNALQEKINHMHFRAFLIMAVEKYPDIISDNLKNNPDFQIDNPVTLEGVFGLLSVKNHKLLPKLPAEQSFEGRKKAFYENVLRETELETIDEIFNDKEALLTAIRGMESCRYECRFNEYDMLDVEMVERGFLQRAIEKQPGLVYGYYEEFRYAVIDNPETLEIVMKLFREKGYKVSPEMFKEPTEAIEPVFPPDTELPEEPELPEEKISPERQLLTELGQLANLPPEVVDIIGSHTSFREAMEEEAEETAFDIFIERLEQLKKTIKPELLSEMLVIAAEASGDLSEFLYQYNAKSWSQAVRSHDVFEIFMHGWWFAKIKKYVRPQEVLHELLIVAAGANKENAKWLLDKAKRDEEGGPMHEEPDYILRETIGDEAFEAVMSVARQMVEEAKEEYESETFTGLKLELSEDVISSERHLLISDDQISNLPPEVVDIIGSHTSFREAMEEEAEEEEAKTAFDIFIERFEQFKKTIKPELLSEMLVIAAEMSDEMGQFLKDYGAVSFRQAMGSHRLFLELMKGWWFKWINESLNQPQLMQELLIAAAKASKENAEWFLKKAMSDEKGEKMPDEKDEKIPDEDEYYNLQKDIGDEAFEAVISAARQMVK